MASNTYRRFLTESANEEPREEELYEEPIAEAMTEEMALAYIVTESYPPILLTLKPEERTGLARWRGAGEGSTQTEIEKSQVTKKPYSSEDSLLVYVAKGKVFAYGNGSQISIVHSNIQDAVPGYRSWARRSRTDFKRKDCIEYADQIFYISSDQTAVSLLRQERGAAKSNATSDQTEAFKKRASSLVQAYFKRIEEKVTKLKDELVALDAELLGNLVERVMSGAHYSFDKSEEVYGKSYDSNKRISYRLALIKRIFSYSEAVRDIKNTNFVSYDYGSSGEFDPKYAAQKLAAISSKLQSLAA